MTEDYSDSIAPVSASNPRYNRDGSIDVDVVWSGFDGRSIPFTASKNDTMQHGRDLFDAIERGEYGAIKPYSDADEIEYIKRQNERKQSDLIAEADSVIRPLSDERDAEIISDDDLVRWKTWVKYRKSLRELNVDYADVKWPDKPS